MAETGDVFRGYSGERKSVKNRVFIPIKSLLPKGAKMADFSIRRLTKEGRTKFKTTNPLERFAKLLYAKPNFCFDAFLQL